MELKATIAGRKIAAAVAILAAVVMVNFATVAVAAPPDAGEPETSVVPAESGSAPQAAAPISSDETPATAPLHKKAAAPRFKFNPRAVEPASARAQLTEDTWAYTEPAQSSAHVERVYKDKYVVITGSTHYFVQVKLKSGKTAYVEQSAVDLVKPTDKVFHLTANAAVLDQPNRWGKKLSEVHAGHDVHVVGIALSYVKIRMRSGLEGFIPTSAMQ